MTFSVWCYPFKFLVDPLRIDYYRRVYTRYIFITAPNTPRHNTHLNIFFRLPLVSFHCTYQWTATIALCKKKKRLKLLIWTKQIQSISLLCIHPLLLCHRHKENFHVNGKSFQDGCFVIAAGTNHWARETNQLFLKQFDIGYPLLSSKNNTNYYKC